MVKYILYIILSFIGILFFNDSFGQKIYIILTTTYLYQQDSIRIHFNDSLVFNQRIRQVDFRTTTDLAKIIAIPKNILIHDINVIKFKSLNLSEGEIVPVEDQYIVVDKYLLRNKTIYFLFYTGSVYILTKKQFNKMDFD